MRCRLVRGVRLRSTVSSRCRPFRHGPHVGFRWSIHSTRRSRRGFRPAQHETITGFHVIEHIRMQGAFSMLIGILSLGYRHSGCFILVLHSKRARAVEGRRSLVILLGCADGVAGMPVGDAGCVMDVHWPGCSGHKRQADHMPQPAPMCRLTRSLH